MKELKIFLHNGVTWSRYWLVDRSDPLAECLFDHVLSSIREGDPRGKGPYGIMLAELDAFIFMANCHNYKVIVV